MAGAAFVRIVGGMLTKSQATARRSGDGQVLGAMLVVLGAGWLLHQADVVDVGWDAVLSALLVTLGIGLVLTAKRSGAGLVIVGIVLTVVLAVTSSAPKIDFDRRVGVFRGAGDKTFEPRVLPESEFVVRHGAGDVNVDLRTAETYFGSRTVRARLDVGDLTIYLPATAKASVTVHVSAGEAHLLDRPAQEGLGVDDSYADEGFDTAEQQLVVDARVGAGKVTVVRGEPG
jgi:hypothetical protein